MKKRLISLLLCLALVCTVMIAGSAVFAAGTDSGMVVNKTATDNGDGTYTIQLEAYATGDKIITEVTKERPADIVLVLDQSGSMDQDMSTYDFRAYRNKNNENFYKLRDNQSSKSNRNLYYRIGDGSYASVSVTREVTENHPVYEKIAQGYNNSSTYRYTSYWENRNNLYVKIAGEYFKVKVERESSGLRSSKYTYTVEQTGELLATSEGSRGKPEFKHGEEKVDMYLLKSNDTDYAYTYSYTDQQGLHEIGTSAGNKAVPEFALYEKYETGSVTRLEALQSAVEGFINSVSKKAAGPDGKLETKEDNVNHRIAIVGFATGDYTEDSWNYPQYENTEVFVGSSQYRYNNGASNHYKEALMNMDTQAGYNNVIASKNSLSHRGATYPNFGLRMAKGILDANPLKPQEERNRVVVLFTDGSPGYSGYDSSVAQKAVDAAAELKNENVSVYTVGIFDGADAKDTTKKENDFMRKVSSNGGKILDPGYYLSAEDATSLNSIFQQIAGQIESGGSSTKLDSKAEIRDIIAPQFKLPEGMNPSQISLETYAYQGSKADPQWVPNHDPMGARVTLESTTDPETNATYDKVNVTGFDFAQNYVADIKDGSGKITGHRGSKLVISFKVQVRDGFFGGNQVNTNVEAGIYPNKDSVKPVVTFPVPEVDVELKNITITIPDTYVYLNGTVRQSDLNDLLTVKIGKDELNMNLGREGYWGVDPWQVQYVNISTPEDFEQFKNITEDKELTIHIDLTPKEQGEAVAHDGTGTGTIHVLKPTVTWKDSRIDLGETADYETQNYVSTVWKYGEMLDSDPVIQDGLVDTREMAPELNFSYDPAEDAFQQDTPVKVTVKLPNYQKPGEQPMEKDVTRFVDFLHQDCSFNGCKWGQEGFTDCQFIVHIDSFDLTITKTVAGETNSNDSFLFTIAGPNNYRNTVVINGSGSVTIKGLPSGQYTVTEESGWSWTYTGGGTQDVTVQNGKAAVEFTNTPRSDIPLCEEVHVDNRWAVKDVK